MKKLTSLLLLILTLTGCTFFDEDDVSEKITVSLSSSRDTYSSSNSSEITVTASILGGSDSKVIIWKLDDKKEEEGGQSFIFTPVNFSNYHLVKCMVIDNGDTINSQIKIKSVAFSDLTVVEQNGRLQVIGTNLCNESGEPIQLRGMSTHGIQYFPGFIDSDMLVQAVATEWNADIIRISCYVNEGWGSKGDYQDNVDYWREFVDRMVDRAEDNGIYALIDWHMLNPGDPREFQSEAAEFWKYMVGKHGSKKHVLFDICNEPNGGVTWSGIKEYADYIMPIIRAKSDNVAIVGTPDWASRPDMVIGNKLDFENVMYTMHFYAASHPVSTYGNYVQKALDAGVPVFVTEFGTQTFTGGGANDFDASLEWLNFMEAKNISWINWNLSNDWRSGAVFKLFVNTSDSLLYVENEGDYWSMSAEDKKIIDQAPTVSYNSVSDYSNTAKMKEAGKWIFDKIKNR